MSRSVLRYFLNSTIDDNFGMATTDLRGRDLLKKYALLFFNIIFWIAGLILIIIGAVLWISYGELFKFADSKFANLPILFITIGLITFIVSGFGWNAAIKENHCLLGTFSGILVSIFLAILVIGILGFAYQSKVDEVTSNALQTAITHYNESDISRGVVDWVQNELACCGIDGPLDYGNTTCDGSPGIESCYKNGECTGKIHDDGCKPIFIDFVEKNMDIVGYVAMASAFVIVMGILFSISLMRVVRTDYAELVVH